MNNEIADQVKSFNKAINNLIKVYNLYDQYNQQIILDYRNNNINAETENLKSGRSNLFSNFIELFDNLLVQIFRAKRESFYSFIQTFQLSNLTIIKFYELIYKILSAQYEFGSGGDLKYHTSILRESLEVLYILTKNQNKQNKDHEITVMCCTQLVNSFNFVGSLCSIFRESTFNFDETIIALIFDTLDKLTKNNPLIYFDDNID